jgi:hypothetical protein
MSDPRNERERLDLRPLAPTDAQADRLIGGVMARLSTRPQLSATRGNVLELVGQYVPPVWIAAAAALLIAVSLAVSARTRQGETAMDRVVTWATRQHVPTNAELLMTFQGYE